MINSYIMGNAFVKINLLLDQYCNRCAQIGEESCEGCNLSHRKNNSSQPILVIPDTEQTRLEVK